MASLADTQRRARRYAADTSDDLYAKVEGAMAYFDRLADEVSRLGGRSMRRAQDTALTAASEADAAVRHHPYAAALAGLTLGFMAGLLLRRW